MREFLKADDLLRRLVAGGLSALVIKVATAGLGYAMFVVLARLMSEPEFGRFAFGFNLAITLSALASLGLTTAALRFWPQYEVEDRPDLGKGFLLWAAAATLLASAAVAGALIGAGRVLSALRPGGEFGYLATAGLLVPCLAASELLSSLLRARGQVVTALAPRDILWRGGVPLLAVLLAWQGFALDGRAALALAAGVLAAMLLGQGIYACRLFARGLARVRPARDLSGWRRAMLPMWGAAVLFAMVQQFDVVLIGLLLSPEQTGPYFAALKTASLLGLMLIAANLIGAPLFSRYYYGHDRAGLQRLCSLLAVGISVPTIGGYLLLAVLGRWLLGLFDPAFADAYALLLVLAIGFAFSALAGPTAYMLQMSGHERSYLRIMLWCYAATVACQCVLTPLFGPMGAAVPNALGVVCWNLWAIRRLRAEIGLDPSLFSLLGRWRAPGPEPAADPVRAGGMMET